MVLGWIPVVPVYRSKGELLYMYGGVMLSLEYLSD